MTKPTVKELITDAVVKQIPEWSYDNAMRRWWVNIRRDGGLRLTDVGDTAFRTAEIEFFDYPFNPKKTLDHAGSYQLAMLELDKKIKCPYFIGVTEKDKKKSPFIRLYDSKIAIVVSLYGDIDGYLNSIRLR